MVKINQIAPDSEKTKTTPRFWRVLFLLVVIAQMAVICLWAAQRNNYHVDELYSLGYAQSYATGNNYKIYSRYSPEWKYETWIENRSLKNQLEISEEESLLREDPLTIARLLLTGRNYHGILNILMSVFAPDRLTMYPGILFNLVVFFFTQILLCRIMKELTGDEEASVMAVLMYGFSTMAVQMTLFIRFYTLTIFLFTAVIRLHQIMWRTENLRRHEFLTILSLLLLYFAMKNSELVFILSYALILSYVLGLLTRKRYRNAVFYLITIVSTSLFYVIRKTNYLEIILHPADYTGAAWPVGIMTESVLEITPRGVIAAMKKCVKWIVLQLFGTKTVFFTFIGVLFILFLLYVLHWKKPAETGQKKKDGGYFWILLGVSAGYMLFAVLTSLPADRYLAVLFPLISILLWSAISFLVKPVKKSRIFFLACTFLSFYGIISQQIINPAITLVYPQDKIPIQTIRETGIQDSVLIYVGVSSPSHTAYDCVSLMPDSASIYPVNEEKHAFRTEEIPDKMLIWIKPKNDVSPYTEGLITAGYDIKMLCKTHASDVYIAERKTGNGG